MPKNPLDAWQKAKTIGRPGGPKGDPTVGEVLHAVDQATPKPKAKPAPTGNIIQNSPYLHPALKEKA